MYAVGFLDLIICTIEYDEDIQIDVDVLCPAVILHSTRHYCAIFYYVTYYILCRGGRQLRELSR